MKTEEFNKTNEELNKEIIRNIKINNENDERKRMAYVNQFDFKVLETLIFSSLPYLAIIIISCILEKCGVMSSITKFIPAESFPFLTIGGSVCIGTICRKMLEFKAKTKERLKAFTNAKTESEKVQEEVKYTIELEKVKNRNKAIRLAMDSLSKNQSILDSLASKYVINDKSLPQDEEEAKKRIEDLSKILKDKYKELDILTTQKVLHEKFWKVRTKSQKVIDIIVSAVLSGAFAMFFTEMPLIIVRDYIASLNLISVFAPLIIAAAGVTGYMIKRNKDYMRVFNILNKDLGENALPHSIKDVYEENQDINSKIKNIINEISVVESQLQEQKRAMESFSNKSGETEETMEPSKSVKLTTEDSQMNIIDGYNQMNNVLFIDDNIYESSEKEASLKLKRK